jgi:hypothetical protein
MIDALEGLAMGLLTRQFNRSPEEAKFLRTKARTDIKNPAIHSYPYMRVFRSFLSLLPGGLMT